MPPLLRYGVFELLLVQPLTTGFWRAPEQPSEGPWPPEDFEGIGAHESMDRSFRAHLSRKPETLTAPVSYPAEIGLIALEALAMAWMLRMTGWRQWLSTVGPLASVKSAVADVRNGAERASARRRGIVAAAAPRPRIMDVTVLYLSALSAGEVVARARRRGTLTPPPWDFATAGLVVRSFNRRRSWERAYTSALAAQRRPD